MAARCSRLLWRGRKLSNGSQVREVRVPFDFQRKLRPQTPYNVRGRQDTTMISSFRTQTVLSLHLQGQGPCSQRRERRLMQYLIDDRASRVDTKLLLLLLGE